MASSAIDLVADTSEDSPTDDASASPPSPPPTQRASRPKLRTRRTVSYKEVDVEQDDSDDDDSEDGADNVEMRVVPRTQPKPAASSSQLPRLPRMTPNRNTIIDDEDDEDDEDEEEEEQEEEDNDEKQERLDGDYEQADDAVDGADDDMDDFEDEESSEDEIDGRRRSGRARKPVFQKAPRRGRLDAASDSDDVMFEAVKKPKKQSRLSKASTSKSRKRKRPPSASRSSSKAKARKRQHSDDDEDDGDDDEEEENADWLLSDDEAAPVNTPVDGEIDENAFIVEKVLAREVHTLKEWTRLRQNKTTRFLQNASIFLDDEEEGEEEQEENRKKTTDTSKLTSASGAENTNTEKEEEEENKNKTTNSSDSSDVVVVVGDKSTEENETLEQKEEERFLVKWKSLSYIHVSWETEKNLIDVDKNIKGKIQRFREKELLGLITDRMHGDEYFNPEFRDVDRILDIQDTPGDKYTPVDDEEEEEDDGNEEDDGEEGGGSARKPKLKYMLIKWKATPYDAITWEREDDVHDDAAVKEYYARLQRAAERYKRLAATPSKSNSKQPQQRKNPQFRGYSATNRPPFKESQTWQLRDYQLTGVNWMLFNWYQRRNSMLADEMGLGKTVQTVTYINHLAQVEGLPGPYLVVAPLSTLAHWQREFTNWTNLNAVIYHGSADARKAIQDYEFALTEDEYWKAFPPSSGSTKKKLKIPGTSGNKPCYRFDVLITTFEMCSVPDFAKLARVKWQLLVVDEAHRLKNRNSKLTLTIQKSFVYENILLLTGTPLQNNVEELWTLLHFLDPQRFESMDEFMDDYGDLKDVSQVEKLHGELKPFLLRRMKEDVEKSLAPKEETIIEVELTVLQKQYYRAIYEQNSVFLARGMKKAHAPSLMNVIMELRKCCNHPFLIKGMEQREVARLRAQKEVSQEERERQAIDLLVTASGKLILLDKLLPRLKENGHRVLIFSQFKIMLDVLQDYLRLRAYKCERIDGSITGNDRQASIDRFCDPASSAFIMLLSTRAGGVGINLTAADTVIIYDSDWNPQNDLQAQARCHRIGQKKSVKIYRLLTAKTYELHMFHQASLKLGLDQAVLGSIRDRDAATSAAGSAALAKTKRPNAQLSKDEIENLLKHGAYEMFKEDKDGEAEAASKRFSEESIDQILSRSTKIIHDPTAAADGEGEDDGSKKKKSLMSSFSKATFVSSDNPDAQVEMDDPDFWSKVIGLQAPEKAVEPSPLKKRRCRVKSYLQEDSGDDEKGGGDSSHAKIGGFPRGKRQQDAEYEEFVISSADDDDDDDEDDDDEEAAKTVLVRIDLYGDRIADLLATFGYGRWQEMANQNTTLAKYPLTKIAAYAQQYVASLIRVAATSFIVVKTQQRPPPPVGEDSLPPVSTAQRNEWLDEFARRFRFVSAMLSEMKLPFVSSVVIAWPSLPRTAVSAKSEREALSKLQQIDRMYSLHVFVRDQIGPMAPMLELMGDFQRLSMKKKHKSSDKITRMILDGVLPAKCGKKKDKQVAEENPPAATTTTDAAEKEKEEKEEETTAKSVETVGEEETKSATEKPQEPAAVVADDPGDGAAEKKEEETTTMVTTKADEEMKEGDETMAVEKEQKQEEAMKEHAGETPDASAVEEKSEEKVDEAATASAVPPPSSGTESLATPTTPTTTKSTSTPPSASTPRIAQEQALRAALTRVQALPELGILSAVAPWWIPIVDDVVLLLFVYKYGWMRARMSPSELLKKSSLFSFRAADHLVTTWPSVATLNKRVKTVLAIWINLRRRELHMKNMRLRKQLQEQTAAAASARVLVPPTAPAGMAPQLYSAGMLQDRQPQPYQQSHHQHADDGDANGQPHSHHPHHHHHHDHHGPPPASHAINEQAVESHMAAKRGRFAKLVFSFGIPDTSACTTAEKRYEKWRYFVQDPQLSISRLPMTELVAEVYSLERFARLRVENTKDAVQIAVQEARSLSIFGGRRGVWTLNQTLCVRLLHRIEMFRRLRGELLVLPPKKLYQLVRKVVLEIRAAELARGDNLFPMWWTPRHDVMLLQGVECYGLDEYLPNVWRLPLFTMTNPTTVFPSTTWVENYVHDITTRAHSYLEARRAASTSTQAAAGTATEAEAPEAEAPVPPQTLEAKQRLRDLRGMRLEDPHFSQSARQRKATETAIINEKKRQQAQQSDQAQAEIKAAAKNMMTALNELKMMKQEDPYHSLRARAIWLHQKRDDEVAAAAKAKAKAEENAKAKDEPLQVIELQDGDEDEDHATTVVLLGRQPPGSSSSSSAAAATASLTTANGKQTSPLKASASTGDGAATTPNAKPNSSSAVTSGSTTTTTSTPPAASGMAKTPTPSSSQSQSQASSASSGQKRKRAPRPWEVIVIDDSEDDNDDDDDGDHVAPTAKRTTRSRRRSRGEELTNGL